MLRSTQISDQHYQSPGSPIDTRLPRYIPYFKDKLHLTDTKCASHQARIQGDWLGALIRINWWTGGPNNLGSDEYSMR